MAGDKVCLVYRINNFVIKRGVGGNYGLLPFGRLTTPSQVIDVKTLEIIIFKVNKKTKNKKNP